MQLRSMLMFFFFFSNYSLLSRLLHPSEYNHETALVEPPATDPGHRSTTAIEQHMTPITIGPFMLFWDYTYGWTKWPIDAYPVTCPASSYSYTYT